MLASLLIIFAGVPVLELRDPSSWQAMAGDLAKGISEGRGCDALCAVIERCGSELSRHFPRQTDDTNELGDTLLTGESGDAEKVDRLFFREYLQKVARPLFTSLFTSILPAPAPICRLSSKTS